ncbi:sigma factor-like helix-turn-helix DNA-binding protein [Sphingomonas spermidinifaciens]|nr:sigma factor-like helix-turn-helix DNA-binding protein [Sphingomonas spermidinifaciens]
MNRELRRLRNALDAMPDPERQVFDRARYRDLDYFQIAAELGITVAEVERRLGSAMAHLIEFRDVPREH